MGTADACAQTYSQEKYPYIHTKNKYTLQRITNYSRYFLSISRWEVSVCAVESQRRHSPTLLAITLSKHCKQELNGGKTTNNGYDSDLWGEKSILAHKSAKPSQGSSLMPVGLANLAFPCLGRRCLPVCLQRWRIPPHILQGRELNSLCDPSLLPSYACHSTDFSPVILVAALWH